MKKQENNGKNKKGIKRNVVLIVVDQLRYDCLGINGNEIISTPNLNQLAAEGYNFTNAYCSVPSCIPARASLMTGLKPENHGRVGYEEGIEWNYDTTLGSAFSEKGYYTKCIGKLHVYPSRRLCGFHHVELHDGYLHKNRKYKGQYSEQFTQSDDYLDWLKEKLGSDTDITDAGLDCNSWVARPWQYEEKYHPTNWVVTRGLDFLKKRDPTMPFFLKLSFVRPHSPLDPPEYYFNMYMEQSENLSEPVTGKWEENREYSKKTYSTTAKTGILPEHEIKRATAAYYGSVTHIDHQIGRFLIGLEEHDLLEDTVIAFVSDHGDQLGEHNLFRKAFPYQGSIHVPLIIHDRKFSSLSEESFNGKQIDGIVELMDILPTLVELGTGEKVQEIDGKSLVSLMENKTADKKKEIRKFLHGEHEMGVYSSQYILTEEWKYIWYSYTGEEQLFHLFSDKNEEVNLINEKKYEKTVSKLRKYLIGSLSGREEGYVEKGKLKAGKTAKPTLNFLKNHI